MFLRAPNCSLWERCGRGWRRVWLRLGGGLQRPLLPPSTALSCPSWGTLSSHRWCSVQSQSGKWPFPFICWLIQKSSLLRWTVINLVPHHDPLSCTLLSTVIICVTKSSEAAALYCMFRSNIDKKEIRSFEKECIDGKRRKVSSPL